MTLSERIREHEDLPTYELLKEWADEVSALEQRVERLEGALQNIAGWRSLESVDDAYAMRESAQEALAVEECKHPNAVSAKNEVIENGLYCPDCYNYFYAVEEKV